MSIPVKQVNHLSLFLDCRWTKEKERSREVILQSGNLVARLMKKRMQDEKTVEKERNLDRNKSDHVMKRKKEVEFADDDVKI